MNYEQASKVFEVGDSISVIKFLHGVRDDYSEGKITNIKVGSNYLMLVLELSRGEINHFLFKEVDKITIEDDRLHVKEDKMWSCSLTLSSKKIK